MPNYFLTLALIPQLFNQKYMHYAVGLLCWLELYRSKDLNRISKLIQIQNALLALKSYAVSSRVVQHCKRLALSNRVHLMWATMVSMEIARTESLSPVFFWHPRVPNRASGSTYFTYLNHVAPHGARKLVVVNREYG
jgi:hypothetical protein